MKPNFALDLSHEGIVLLHRSARGRWTVVGEVPLDAADLGEQMSFLRQTAVGLEGKGFATKLIIPNSQILYRVVAAPGPGENERRGQIMSELDGVTPYDVNDLSFDWFGHGQTVQVAVVANETLEEAEDFAIEHRFNPVSFVARGEWNGEEWEPYLGRTDFSHAFLGPDSDPRETPIGGIDIPEVTNLFAESAEAPVPHPEAEIADEEDDAAALDADTNLFAESDEAEAPLPGFSAEPSPESSADEAPVAMPAFSTTRSGTDPLAAPSTRPIARVAPRIAIVPQGEPTPRPRSLRHPADEPDRRSAAQDLPPLVASDNLRASLLGPESQSARAGGRLGGLVGGLLKKKPKAEGDLAAGPARTGFFGRIMRRRTKDAGAEPAASAEDDHAAGWVPEVEAGPEDLAAALAAPDLTPEPAAARRPLHHRREVRAAIAALAMLGLFGLIYMLFPDSEVTTEAVEGSGAVETSARPHERPADLVTASLGTAPEDEAGEIAPIRPARRSLFEESGETDPLADAPDTATPIESLSPEELNEMREAGLLLPGNSDLTDEELAETGDEVTPSGPSEEEVAVTYAETGALIAVTEPVNPDDDSLDDDIWFSSVDRDLEANDAIILPDFSDGPQDDQPKKRMSPLAADLVFDLDARGLVRATAEGALNPEGILVYAGKPPLTPPAKPATEALVPPDPLAALKPKPRPDALKTGVEAVFIQGRLTLPELRERRPKGRPDSIQQAAAAQEEGTAPTELAVAASRKPSHRPSDFTETVNAAVASAVSNSATANNSDSTDDEGGNNRVVATGPALPTRANVAKQATIKNAINLGELNVIGVYGSPSTRRALLRLPSGRFVRVKPGDRVDGGQVAAIDVNSISYVKGGRNRVLKIPD
jgi:hypothetical protein